MNQSNSLIRLLDIAGDDENANAKSVIFRDQLAIHEKSLAYRVHRAWMKVSPEVPKRKNPLPATTKGFGTFCLVMCFLVAVSKVLMGIFFMDECPTNDWIPIYQLGGGLLALLFLATIQFRKYHFVRMSGIPIGITTIIWFSVSSVYTFVEFQPDYFKGGRRYCEYYFYFYCVFVQYAEFLLYILILFFVCIKFGFHE